MKEHDEYTDRSTTQASKRYTHQRDTTRDTQIGAQNKTKKMARIGRTPRCQESQDGTNDLERDEKAQKRRAQKAKEKPDRINNTNTIEPALLRVQKRTSEIGKLTTS